MSLNMSKQTKRHVKPVLPPDEAKRLATLYFLELLDSAPQEQFDRIARMAQRLFTVPIAVISFIDADREWFKSSIGVDVSELPREFAFASTRSLPERPSSSKTPRSISASSTTRSCVAPQAFTSMRGARSRHGTASTSAHSASWTPPREA